MIRIDNWNTFKNDYNPDETRVVKTMEYKEFKKIKTIKRKKHNYFIGTITRTEKTEHIIKVTEQDDYYNNEYYSYKVDLVKTEECKAKCKFYSVCLLIKNNLVNQKIKDVININNIEYKNKCMLRQK